MKKTYEVFVFNTITGKYEKVAVSKEVYRAYMRTAWNIRDNDKSFYTHETQFSALNGGEDGAFENFREFIDDSNSPEILNIECEKLSALHRAIENLPQEERAVIKLFYFHGLSSREIGRLFGITEQAVTKRRRSAFKRLRKILKNF